MGRPAAAGGDEQPEPPAKASKNGARVTWLHATTDGAVITRTGVIWSEAPTSRSGAPGGEPGAYVLNVISALWVVPDQPLPGDRYSAIYVGKSLPTQSCKPFLWSDDPATEKKLDGHHRPTVPPSTWHSCDDPASPTGYETAYAGERAAKTRAKNSPA
jgi:hypothetical protein